MQLKRLNNRDSKHEGRTIYKSAMKEIFKGIGIEAIDIIKVDQ
jgi:hypothetical protein